MKIGILTSGGDCPGLNAVIRGAVIKGDKLFEDEFIGFKDGWRGVIENDWITLPRRRVRGIGRIGGTILGTSRSNPFADGEDGAEIVLAALGLEPPALPSGIVVAAAPHPVRNAELMRILRRAVGRPFGVPTPAPLLRLGAALLRTDPALGLTGRHATSRVLDEADFHFRYPRLEDAVAELL